MRASWIRKSLLTAAAGVFAIAAVPAQAQLSTTANGPYYATPSWDQKLTTNRFVILANWGGWAVLDRETGLVWQRSPDAIAGNWFEAQEHCNDLVVGGRKGWRLPGLQELASLVDPTVAPPGPMLPANHPFINVQSFLYWSAASSAAAAVPAPTAWYVYFFNGAVGLGYKTANLAVWCVRGGQVPDAQ